MTFIKAINTLATFTPTIVSLAPYDTGPFTYAWNFGDTATSTSAIPTHTYTSMGPVTVTLSVTNTATGVAASSSQDGFISGPVIPGNIPNTRLLFNGQTGGSIFFVPSSGDINRVELIFNNSNATNMYPSMGIGTAHAFGTMTDPSIQIDMLIPTRIDAYSMIYADIAYHGIWKWELFGSNALPLADGSNMSLVDQKDIGYLSVNPYTSTLVAPATFRYYRLVSHATNNGNAVNRMLELRFLRTGP